MEGEEQLAGALCALAERLLGSADTVQAVQADCEQLLQQAQQICPTSPEPQQVPPDCLTMLPAESVYST